MQKYVIYRVDIKVNLASVLRIKNTYKENKITLFYFYFTVFKTLLFRFSNAKDLYIRIGDANRLKQNIFKVISLFINLLFLRFRF